MTNAKPNAKSALRSSIDPSNIEWVAAEANTYLDDLPVNREREAVGILHKSNEVLLHLLAASLLLGLGAALQRVAETLEEAFTEHHGALQAAALDRSKSGSLVSCDRPGGRGYKGATAGADSARGGKGGAAQHHHCL